MTTRPTRKSLGLAAYHYAQPGAYFVTICARNRRCLFGEVAGGVMRLSAFGKIVEECWESIPAHFVGVALDEFIVMPNHFHEVLFLRDVGARHASPLPPHEGQPDPAKSNPTLSTVIGSFKAAASKRIRQANPNAALPIWQRGFYDHVIRTEPALREIRQYVANNPLKWELDRDNPRNWRTLSEMEAPSSPLPITTP